MASASTSASAMDCNKEKLLKAAYCGDLSLLKSVAMSLSKGKGIAETVRGIKCPYGLSALHYAAAGGNPDICRYLIKEFGIPVDLPAKGGTPLLLAAKDGRYDTVKYLIEQGADPAAADKQCSTPLYYAASFEIVKLLLSRRVPVDPKSHRGTPLCRAAGAGHERIMKILLEHGADINYLSGGLVSPLICCIMTSSLKCTKFLIKAGADLNISCPLVLAIHQNKMDIMKCLLDGGADPNIPIEDGRLPIEVAAVLDRKEMVEILFPLTSPIRHVKCWSVEGLYKHVSCEAYQRKYEVTPEMTLADFKRLGRDAFRKKDFLGAKSFYDGAIGIDPTDAALYTNRSICWLQAGFGEHALKDAYSARSLKPDWPKAHYRVGAALMLLKEYKQASQAFADGLKLDPTNEDISKALRNALDCMDEPELRRLGSCMNSMKKFTI